MKHCIIRDTSLNGWEYGMLRSFENAISTITQAPFADIPDYLISDKITKHLSYGMRRSVYRKYLPKAKWTPKADVAWYVLMGPENYKLDLFQGMEFSKKILYLYDTFPSQYSIIQQICQRDHWDILITSFNDAVVDLEKVTGRRWISIEQAADHQIFNAEPFEKKVIDFSAYGRKYPLLHEVTMEFCSANGLYYDYTTHDTKHPTADSVELYKQYAWHLNHSKFTFSWPVELTNPTRAGHLNPITCRWFEAMAAGTPIIGLKPGNRDYDTMLESSIVIDINPHLTRSELLARLEMIWAEREKHLNDASAVMMMSSGRNSWEERVQRILNHLKKNH